MSIEGKIDNDMKDALRKREKVRLSTLRMLKSQLKNEKIERKRDLTEEEEIKVISSYFKKLKDSLMTYQKSGREDIVSQIKEEIEVVEAYLPPPLTSKEIEKIVRDVVSDIGKDKKNMGRVMKEVIAKVGPRADGKIIKKVVEEILSS